MRNPIAFSVVIPIYNEEGTIPEMLTRLGLVIQQVGGVVLATFILLCPPFLVVVQNQRDRGDSWAQPAEFQHQRAKLDGFGASSTDEEESGHCSNYKRWRLQTGSVRTLFVLVGHAKLMGLRFIYARFFSVPGYLCLLERSRVQPCIGAE